MKYFLSALVLSLALVNAAAHAASVTIPFQNWQLTFTDVKCTDKDILTIFEMIDLRPELKDKIYAGSLKGPGHEKGLKLCYVVAPEDTSQVLIVDATGDAGVINVGSKKLPGI